MVKKEFGSFLTDAERIMVEDACDGLLPMMTQQGGQILPAFVALKSLLLCGIAVHHSGMIPLLKEAVELFVQEGLIKASASIGNLIKYNVGQIR